MRSVKRTYWLPSHVASEFDRSVTAGQRSALVARLINGWLDEQERQKLRADIIEGCREMWDVHLEIEKEFHPLEEEVERKYGGYEPGGES